MIPFSEAVALFSQLKPYISPAEIHGMVCGFICAGNDLHGKAAMSPFLKHTSENPEVTAKARHIVLELYRESTEKIQNFEFDFQMLLPDDDETLALRSEALSHWCQGFLIALKMVGIERSANDECQQILERFTEIATIDFESIEFVEDDEKTFLEVTEYARFAILLFYNEKLSSEGNSSFEQPAQIH